MQRAHFYDDQPPPSSAQQASSRHSATLSCGRFFSMKFHIQQAGLLPSPPLKKIPRPCAKFHFGPPKLFPLSPVPPSFVLAQEEGGALRPRLLPYINQDAANSETWIYGPSFSFWWRWRLKWRDGERMERLTNHSATLGLREVVDQRIREGGGQIWVSVSRSGGQSEKFPLARLGHEICCNSHWGGSSHQIKVYVVVYY